MDTIGNILGETTESAVGIVGLLLSAFGIIAIIASLVGVIVIFARFMKSQDRIKHGWMKVTGSFVIGSILIVGGISLISDVLDDELVPVVVEWNYFGE